METTQKVKYKSHYNQTRLNLLVCHSKLSLQFWHIRQEFYFSATVYLRWIQAFDVELLSN